MYPLGPESILMGSPTSSTLYLSRNDGKQKGCKLNLCHCLSYVDKELREVLSGIWTPDSTQQQIGQHGKISYPSFGKEWARGGQSESRWRLGPTSTVVMLTAADSSGQDSGQYAQEDVENFRKQPWFKEANRPVEVNAIHWCFYIQEKCPFSLNFL
jgi:hypothetical protein